MNALPPLLIDVTMAAPRRVHLDVGAERADRDFLVREVVGVEARAANALGVIDAVGDDARLVLDAEDFVARLLALVAAADVEPLHADARRLGQRAPGVGRVRHADQLFAFQVGADLCRRDVNHRRGAGDDDVFGEPAELQLRVNGEGLAEDDPDVFAHVLAEPLELEGHAIGAGWQGGEEVAAVGLGDRRALSLKRGRRHSDGHTRKHGSLRVAHGSGETALADLGEAWRRRQEDGGRRQGPRGTPLSISYSLLKTHNNSRWLA